MDYIIKAHSKWSRSEKNERRNAVIKVKNGSVVMNSKEDQRRERQLRKSEDEELK